MEDEANAWGAEGHEGGESEAALASGDEEPVEYSDGDEAQREGAETEAPDSPGEAETVLAPAREEHAVGRNEPTVAAAEPLESGDLPPDSPPPPRSKKKRGSSIDAEPQASDRRPAKKGAKKDKPKQAEPPADDSPEAAPASGASAEEEERGSWARGAELFTPVKESSKGAHPLVDEVPGVTPAPAQQVTSPMSVRKLQQMHQSAAARLQETLAQEERDHAETQAELRQCQSENEALRRELAIAVARAGMLEQQNAKLRAVGRGTSAEPRPVAAETFRRTAELAEDARAARIRADTERIELLREIENLAALMR